MSIRVKQRRSNGYLDKRFERAEIIIDPQQQPATSIIKPPRSPKTILVALNVTPVLSVATNLHNTPRLDPPEGSLALNIAGLQ